MTSTHARSESIATRRWYVTNLVALAGMTACVSLNPIAHAAVPSLPTVPIALSGQAAPGNDATTGYLRFGRVSLNASGQVLFDAALVGPNVTDFNDTAAYTGPRGGLQTLAREGQAAPGANPAAVYGDLLDIGGITAQGQGILLTELKPLGGGGIGRGTFAGSTGDLRLVHQHAPSEAIIGHPVLNTGPRAVLWPYASEHLIYWDGATASQVPTPGGIYQPTMNASGRIAFTSHSTDEPYGLYAGLPGAFQPVAVFGTPAPGMPAGHKFVNVLDASQNNAGALAFLGATQSASGDYAGWGLWAGQPNDLRLLAHDGQPAPGMPAGYRFERILWDIDSPTTPPVGAAGHVPFWASLEDASGTPQGTGVWLAKAGQPTRKLASSGDAVLVSFPGEQPTTFELGQFHQNGLWVNAAGVVAIHAVSGLDDGLLVASPDGDLTLIAAEGHRFTVSPGDVRQVSDLWIVTGSSGEDGRASPFNDAGQIVYRLSFTDGSSGLFMTTVPEPGAAALAIIVSVGLLVRRARRATAVRRELVKRLQSTGQGH